MITDANIQFKSGSREECIGFSSKKPNNFNDPIILIFKNNSNVNESYIIGSFQHSEHDFIQLFSNEENLSPTTKKINDTLFYKTYEFSIESNSEKEILMTPFWEKKLELSNKLVLIDYQITLIFQNSSETREYQLFCFQNINGNHNPCERIKNDLDIYLGSLKQNFVNSLTSQRRPLQQLTNTVNLAPEQYIETLTSQQVTEKQIIFKKSKPGNHGVERTTPSPEAPAGADKNMFSHFYFERNDQLVPKPPSKQILKETQFNLLKPRPMPIEITNSIPPPPPKKKKSETQDDKENPNLQEIQSKMNLRNILN